MTGDAAVDAAIAFCEAQGIGRGRHQVPPARLGPQPPALLGLPDPGRALPGLRHRAREAREPAGAAARRRDLRQARQPARPPSDLGAGRPAPPAAARRGARPTRWTPSSTSSWYFARFTAPHAADADGDGRGRLLDERRPVYRRHRARDPAPALLALLRPGDADRPATCRRRRSSRSTRSSPKAWSRTRPTRRTARTAAPVWREPAEVVRDASGARLADGTPVEIGASTKMSKSKKNVVDPDDIIARYGADTARWFVLSDSPPERDVEWTAAGAEAAHRHLGRVWRLAQRDRREAATSAERRRRGAACARAHRAIRDVTADIEGFAFNKAIARLYELTGAIGKRAGRRAGAALRAPGAGAADRADDAAPRRGGLVDARAARGSSPRRPGRRPTRRSSSRRA